jgi:acyl-CoA thioesterase FadM
VKTELTPDGLQVVGRWTARGDEIGADAVVPPARVLSWLEHGRWCALEAGDGVLAPLFKDGNIMVVRAHRLALGVGVGWQGKVKTGVGLTRVGNSSVELAQSIWTDEENPRCVAELRLVGVALGVDRRPRVLPQEVRLQAHAMAEPPGLAGLTLPNQVDGTYTWSAPVRASEIDLFRHVNHARYADWSIDALRAGEAAGSLGSNWQAGRPIAALIIDYVREVVFGETIAATLQAVGADDVQVSLTVAGEVRARAALRLGQRQQQ